jgi:hypothetical protein
MNTYKYYSKLKGTVTAVLAVLLLAGSLFLYMHRTGKNPEPYREVNQEKSSILSVPSQITQR